MIFELANHIADVKDAHLRKRLANKLASTISSSLEDAEPWTITPPGNPDSIRELIEALGHGASRFAEEFSLQKLGLTDTVVIMEAERLREKNPSSQLKSYYVHIWTMHRELKSREPDAQPAPFVL